MSGNNAAIPQFADAQVRSFYRGRKVLVAGADGFLGFNCARTLERLGACVSVVTRRSVPRVGEVAGSIFRGDLRGAALARSAVTGQTIVFDFVGSAGAVESNRDPQNSLEQDCRPHLTLFQACAEAVTKPLVMFASTRLVYGKPLYLPVHEQHPLNPESLYAVHKITVENYLRVLRIQHGLGFCIFRISNPYGPFQENNGKEYGVINRFLRTASRGEEILVYGDGRQQRDYIHVDDVIAAFLLAAMNPGCDGQVFNLGGTSPVSIATAARDICRLGNSKLRFIPWPEEYRAVETGDYITDLGKLSACIRIPPPVIWEQGLASAFDYYRQEAARHKARNSRRKFPHISAEVPIP